MVGCWALLMVGYLDMCSADQKVHSWAAAWESLWVMHSVALLAVWKDLRTAHMMAQQPVARWAVHWAEQMAVPKVHSWVGTSVVSLANATAERSADCSAARSVVVMDRCSAASLAIHLAVQRAQWTADWKE